MLNTKRSFYPEKSHVKRASVYTAMVLLSNMANQVKNPFKCHNYTIYVKKNGYFVSIFLYNFVDLLEGNILQEKDYCQQPQLKS